MTKWAGRRGPAFDSRPAHESPDFGRTRKYAIIGDIAGGVRKSGFRELVRMAVGESGHRNLGISSWCHGGGSLVSGGALSDVSVARFIEDFRRKRGSEIDYLRQPAGARI